MFVAALLVTQYQVELNKSSKLLSIYQESYVFSSKYNGLSN